MFKVGDKVTWSSQARGCTKTKTGTIVKIVHRHDFVGRDTPYRMADREFQGHIIMFSGYNIPGNSDVAYFIEVITGLKAKPRLYMPYPSKLEAAKGE